MSSSCELLVRPKLDKVALKKLAIASVLCFVFMIGEVIGGYIANSLAIATDAAHMLVDLASFLISMASVYLASRPPGKKLHFGWHRAETLGAQLSILLIWGVTAVLVYMAITRLIHGVYDINSTIMLITASVGLVFNILMAATLHGVGNHHHHHHHDHHHNHHHHDHHRNHHHHLVGNGSMIDNIAEETHNHNHHLHSRHHNHHQHQSDSQDGSSVLIIPDNNHEDDVPLLNDAPNFRDVLCENASTATDRLISLNSPINDVVLVRPRLQSYRSTKPSSLMNINVRAAFIHVLGDILQSVGVLVASLIIFFWPQYKIADPICTFVFSALVLLTTVRILYDTTVVLMNACPSDISQEEMCQDLKSIPGVAGVHNLRVWKLSNEHVVASVHIILEKPEIITNILTSDLEQADRQLHQQHLPKKVLIEIRRIMRGKYSIGDVTAQVEPWGTFDGVGVDDDDGVDGGVVGGHDDDDGRVEVSSN